MHRARSAAFVTLLTLVVGAPSIALAQSSTGELTEAPNEHRIAGDLGFFYRREGPADVALVQPSLYGNFTAAHLTNDVFLQIDVAWRMIGIAGTYSGFRAMNESTAVGACGAIQDHWRRSAASEPVAHRVTRHLVVPNAIWVSERPVW